MVIEAIYPNLSILLWTGFSSIKERQKCVKKIGIKSAEVLDMRAKVRLVEYPKSIVVKPMKNKDQIPTAMLVKDQVRFTVDLGFLI
ncbi:MAG: hypothetical protein ABIG55_02595 [Candidatus Omnitrophota bacterium]